MPFIRSITTCSLSQDQQAKLEEGFANILQQVAEKPRSVLVVQFQDGQTLLVGGTAAERFAVVEVQVAGTLSKQQKQSIVSECNALYAELLSFTAYELYVIFTEVERENWALRGGLLG